jgi:hypothetical protein
MIKIPSTTPFPWNEFEYMRNGYQQRPHLGDGDFTRRCSTALEELIGAQKVLRHASCSHALEMAALLLIYNRRRGHLFHLRLYSERVRAAAGFAGVFAISTRHAEPDEAN